MTLVGPGPESLGEFRSFCLHDQPPAEARQMCAAGRELRRLRLAAGLSRRELAARLAVGVDLVVAIENGYGRLAVALPLVGRAGRLAGQDPNK